MRGRDTEPPRRTCRYCRKLLTGKQRRFCGRLCNAKWWSSAEGQAYKRRSGSVYVSYVTSETRGRVCKYCQAYDDEAPFHPHVESTCGACSRAWYRNGACMGCGKLLYCHEDCLFCRPPVSKLRVYLVERGPRGRERSVFRAVNQGRVKVGDKLYVINKLPLVITVPTKVFVKARH